MPHRARNLFDQIAERDNFRLAFLKAAKGKRNRHDVRVFASDLETNIQRMLAGLLGGTYPLGRFEQFVIRDPKERIITAPKFEERVLHHAILNVCEPVFDSRLISDTFACRVGKGRNKAVERARFFARRNSYFLKLDYRKYFDSIPHDRLIAHLERMIKDRRLLNLFARIIGAFRGTLGVGLPIGSLTSQHFANSYLGQIDRLVKEVLRMRGYVRYMDDLAIWGENPGLLKTALHSINEFSQERLRLQAKDFPFINRTSSGMDFLGCRIWPTHVTLNRRSRLRFSRRMADLENEFHHGLIDDIERQLERLVWRPLPVRQERSLGAFVRLCYQIWWLTMIRLESGEPWRELEQQSAQLPFGES